MKRSLLLLPVLLLASLPAAGADKWTRVQSRNFTLIGNATENQIREVAEGLEVFRTAFSRFFKLKEGSSIATTVVVFRSDQAFKPFKPIYKGKAANVEGYFMGREDVNFIVLAADMQTPRVIYHEYVHRMMSDNMASLPLWFQEGFAESFSTFETEGRDKKVRLGRAIGEHVALLNERVFMPLEQLFAVQHGSREYNEEEKQGLFYAESWAFVHYMMFNSEGRRAQFNNFITALGTGTPAADAFRTAFGTELSAFQKEFEAYIQQRMAWNAFEMNTPTGLDRNKDVTARVMSEAEAESALGDLLLRLGRPADAQPHLQKAVELDPKLASVQSTMGRYLQEKGDLAGASAFLKRATELDPSNYLTHYYYASLIHRQKTTSESELATLRSELQKTIELAPNFVEATQLLADVNLSRNTDIERTVELLAKALQVAPGNDYMLVQLAFALSRTQQRENARPLTRNLLLKPTLEPRLRQDAQNLLAFLDRAAAADTANRAIAEQRAARNVRTVPAETLQPASAASADETAAPAVQRREVVDPLLAQPVIVETIQPQRPVGTAKIRGLLTLLDCRNGMTISLSVDGKIVKLYTSTPAEIKFTSFNPAVNGTIACGPAPGNGVPAEIVYRPRPSEDSIGEPVAIDFVDPSK